MARMTVAAHADGDERALARTSLSQPRRGSDRQKRNPTREHQPDVHGEEPAPPSRRPHEHNQEAEAGARGEHNRREDDDGADNRGMRARRLETTADNLHRGECGERNAEHHVEDDVCEVEDRRAGKRRQIRRVQQQNRKRPVAGRAT